jgi:hypothetical protein
MAVRRFSWIYKVMMNDYCSSKWPGFVVGCLVSLVGAVVPGLATAAGVAIEVSDCLVLEDNFARLACYDAKARAAARLNVPAPAASAVAAAPVAAAVAAPVAPVAAAPTAANVDPVLGIPVRQGPEPVVARKGTPQAGSSDASTADFGKAPSQTADQRGKKELHDRIEALDTNGEGGWLVTLASGQVWRQNGSRRYNLRVGQEVRIYPSGWGDSYRLAVAELGSFIPVDRTR